ncbi:MAG: L-threonylcarbamoyladenylate synthase [Planctomycetia bacterium]|nr:L-threonylcarbamoyladenylate synthase [Planctomycetia bacterium]
MTFKKENVLTICQDQRGSTTWNDAIQRAARAILHDQIVLLPTETVYGIGARAFSDRANRKLCHGKNRRPGHALPLVVRDWNMLETLLSNADPRAKVLANAFWPGPITIVIDVDTNDPALNQFEPFAKLAVMPQSSLGFRAPNHPFVLDLLQELNQPITLTSANLTGRQPVRSIDEAIQQLGDFLDLIVDDGRREYASPSTVLKLEKNNLALLRQGAINMEQIISALNSSL